MVKEEIYIVHEKKRTREIREGRYIWVKDLGICQQIKMKEIKKTEAGGMQRREKI